MVTITYNELRRIKDALPEGSMHRMAELLNQHVDSVRTYFGGDHANGSVSGVHYEQGPNGGVVTFDDPTMLNLAKMVLKSHKIQH